MTMMHVIIVHTIEHVMAALEAAAEVGGMLILQSHPDAIFYAGSLYLWNMYECARRSYPDVKSRFILDCADAGAEAVAAMQMGHRALRSNAPAELKAKLADIAAQNGIELVDEPYRALDLGREKDPKASCKAWLEEHTT